MLSKINNPFEVMNTKHLDVNSRDTIRNLTDQVIENKTRIESLQNLNPSDESLQEKKVACHNVIELLKVLHGFNTLAEVGEHRRRKLFLKKSNIHTDLFTPQEKKEFVEKKILPRSQSFARDEFREIQKWIKELQKVHTDDEQLKRFIEDAVQFTFSSLDKRMQEWKEKGLIQEKFYDKYKQFKRQMLEDSPYASPIYISDEPKINLKPAQQINTTEEEMLASNEAEDTVVEEDLDADLQHEDENKTSRAAPYGGLKESDFEIDKLSPEQLEKLTQEMIDNLLKEIPNSLQFTTKDEKGKPIGSGMFGEVYLIDVEDKQTLHQELVSLGLCDPKNSKVIIKIIKTAESLPSAINTVLKYEAIEDHIREGKIGKKLNNKNFTGCSKSVPGSWNGQPAIICRYENQADIREFFSKLPENIDRGPILVSFIQNIMDGLVYAHQHGVVNLDIAARNILVNGSLEEGFVAVLSDWGNAYEIGLDHDATTEVRFKHTLTVKDNKIALSLAAPILWSNEELLVNADTTSSGYSASKNIDLFSIKIAILEFIAKAAKLNSMEIFGQLSPATVIEKWRNDEFNQEKYLTFCKTNLRQLLKGSDLNVEQARQVLNHFDKFLSVQPGGSHYSNQLDKTLEALENAKMTYYEAHPKTPKEPIQKIKEEPITSSKTEALPEIQHQSMSSKQSSSISTVVIQKSLTQPEEKKSKLKSIFKSNLEKNLNKLIKILAAYRDNKTINIDANMLKDLMKKIKKDLSNLKPLPGFISKEMLQDLFTNSFPIAIKLAETNPLIIEKIKENMDKEKVKETMDNLLKIAKGASHDNLETILYTTLNQSFQNNFNELKTLFSSEGLTWLQQKDEALAYKLKNFMKEKGRNHKLPTCKDFEEFKNATKINGLEMKVIFWNHLEEITNWASACNKELKQLNETTSDAIKRRSVTF